jgi:hypothetical protein
VALAEAADDLAETPLRGVRQTVFAIPALEPEPVDPRP